MSVERTSRGKGERGMALVMVLGVLAVSSLLIMHAMTVSEVISRDAYVSSRRMELRYQAESAADEAFWMHQTDRRLFSSRRLGVTSENRADSSFDPWMADRRAHPLYEGNCQAYIARVEKSIQVSSTDSFKKHVDVDDTETLELITDFLNVLSDYTDSDSTARLNGKEDDDYEAEGLADMPRNGDMQFKEELYWLDGWEDALLGEVTIIPPSGKSLSSSSNPSFFSASEEEIRRILDADDATMETLLEARRLWTEEGTPLEDSLPADLMANVSSSFSFTETDVAAYIVSSATPEGDIRVLHEVVRGSNISATSVYADSSNQAFSIWMRTVF